MKSQGLFSALSILIICTFCLVGLGGIVHNTGSSLACPDWPLCFGQVFPKMEGAVAIEHSHRLLATFVGFLTLIWLFLARGGKRGARQKFLSQVATVLVIFQGVLGGMTVLLKISPIMSTAHLITSQIYLSVVWLGWLSEYYRPELEDSDSHVPRSEIFKFAPFLLIIFLIQMGIGAFIRHSGASVSCGLGPESMWLCPNSETGILEIWPNSSPAQWNMIHRFFGVFVWLALVFSTLKPLKFAKKYSQKGLRRTVVSIHILTTLQVALGIMTIATGIQIHTVTAHLVVAMVIWMQIWNLWIQTGLAEIKFLNSVPSKTHLSVNLSAKLDKSFRNNSGMKEKL
jgi:heme A synthase